MKKMKTTTPFYFQDQSHQQMVNEVNTQYPISLKYNHDLVERVYSRYPMINKSEVGIIVKAIFSSFRDSLVLGEILNFHHLFFDVKLKVFKHRREGRILPCLKVHVSTPPQLKIKEITDD
jgi:hypothetical protein